MSNYKDMIIDGFIAKIYETTDLAKNDDSDARLYTLYNTILELSPKYEGKEHIAEAVLMDLAQGLFKKQ